MSEIDAVHKVEASTSPRLLAGKYEVISAVSRGAFGQIYRVRTPDFDKDLAAKVVTPEASTPESIKRLAREAQALSKLQHPNIVKVHTAAVDEKAGLVVVMDYLDGVPLSTLIRDGKRFDLPIATDIAKQICSGLEYASKNGIYHRDVKPSNVIILDADSAAPRAVLIDFGIAKVQEVSQKLTQTGAVLGSPMYMSPEQFMGFPVDQRSDIYSFGCLFYELLTGRPPFEADNAMALAAMHGAGEVTPPSVVNTTVPRALENMILKCLEKTPDARYLDFAAVVADLDACDFSDVSQVKRRRLKQWLKAVIVAIPLVLFLSGIFFIIQNTGKSEDARVGQLEQPIADARQALYSGHYHVASNDAFSITRAYQDGREKPSDEVHRYAIAQALVIRGTAELLEGTQTYPGFDNDRRFSDSWSAIELAEPICSATQQRFASQNDFHYTMASIALVKAEDRLAGIERDVPVEAYIAEASTQWKLITDPILKRVLEYRILIAKAGQLAARKDYASTPAIIAAAEHVAENFNPDSPRAREQSLWQNYAKMRFSRLRAEASAIPAD